MNSGRKKLEAAASEIGLELASLFFLDEAFKYIHVALLRTIKDDIWAGYNEIQYPDEPQEQDDDNPSVIVVSADFYEEVTAGAESSGHKLDRIRTVSAIELIGHVVNLAAFIECIVNRQLYYMRKLGSIEEQHYTSLDRTEAIPKILFAFKDEVLSRKLSIGRIKHLFRLRNQAVHYKDTSTRSMNVTIEELLGIWQEVNHLLGFANLGSYEKHDFASGQPTQAQFGSKVNEVINKWIA